MPKRVLRGTVVGNGMNKTVKVKVERRFRHPLYHKYIKSTKTYLAHDEEEKAQVGDRVEILECRPLSKRKSWMLQRPNEAGSS